MRKARLRLLCAGQPAINQCHWLAHLRIDNKALPKVCMCACTSIQLHC